jgi:hypothetical protein
MHATVRIYNQPELADELSEHADEIRELMTSVNGLQWYCLFRTEAGCASLTVCDTEDGTEASTDTVAAWFREHVGTITEPEPQIARGEVIASV